MGYYRPMRNDMSQFKKIADALCICMPETIEEQMYECEDCPYFECCKPEESIAVPAELMADIRNYFSRYYSKKVQ